MVAACLLTVLVIVYLAPSYVAHDRKAPSLGTVVVVNVLLGWTVVGWIVALAMAYRDKPPQL